MSAAPKHPTGAWATPLQVTLLRRSQPPAPLPQPPSHPSLPPKPPVRPPRPQTKVVSKPQRRPRQSAGTLDLGGVVQGLLKAQRRKGKKAAQSSSVRRNPRTGGVARKGKSQFSSDKAPLAPKRRVVVVVEQTAGGVSRRKRLSAVKKRILRQRASVVFGSRNPKNLAHLGPQKDGQDLAASGPSCSAPAPVTVSSDVVAQSGMVLAATAPLAPAAVTSDLGARNGPILAASSTVTSSPTVATASPDAVARDGAAVAASTTTTSTSTVAAAAPARPTTLECKWEGCEAKFKATLEDLASFKEHLEEHARTCEKSGPFQCRWVGCQHTSAFGKLLTLRWHAARHAKLGRPPPAPKWTEGQVEELEKAPRAGPVDVAEMFELRHGKEIDECLVQMLPRLAEMQRSLLRQENQMKTASKTRYVAGLRQANRDVLAGKARLVVVASRVENLEVELKGLRTLLGNATVKRVPVVAALSRKALAYLLRCSPQEAASGLPSKLKMKFGVTALAVLSPYGAEQTLNRLLSLIASQP